MEEQNILLKELWPVWFKENGTLAKEAIRLRHPEITNLAEQTKIMGHETYAALVSKEDGEPLIFFTIDYSEPALIGRYV